MAHEHIRDPPGGESVGASVHMEGRAPKKRVPSALPWSKGRKRKGASLAYRTSIRNHDRLVIIRR
ncbi:hypothetical protein COLO4_04215 [Corchorus olitorius]|uniref:Uncharacterized protein n=1 Tax=Corchorus olitorius TaxID=93759 RepID=A0A1R3KUY4_9ROSI|nr:hypothetical protein COLO4_04215 [Corchorus olitorius]